ncbi:MAG: ABC transporter ATP-binding protein, partial [Deltaproteobacteria bacterium]
MRDIILKGHRISRNFGGLQALKDVSFEVEQGKIFAIIGPNGAGKTTLFNIISGFDRHFGGEILFMDKVISGLSSHLITRKGIGRTFQNVRLFNNLSVLENVAVGCNGWVSAKLFRSIFGVRSSIREENSIRKYAEEMLQFVGLEKKKDHEVESLPLGEQKLLEIARGLAAKPKLLLLDEPGAGLNEKEMESLKTIVFKIKEKGITQIIVEHNMKFIMTISDEIMVLNFGRKIARGTPKEITKNEK